MKRFKESIKLEDLIYYEGGEVGLDGLLSQFDLPEPRLDGDNFRINIIIDEELNQEIQDFSLNEFKRLVDKKGLQSPKNFQERVVDRFKTLYNDKPEWMNLLALQYLHLTREHLYRLNIQVQKSKHQLTPMERKSLRFHTGLVLSKVFEAVFLYQLPYFIKDVDFSKFTKIFNPVLLSGSFPEYFLSDYFCFLEIKNPLWTRERFMYYREMLLESARHGLGSFIGVALTSKGDALQKLHRLIKGRSKQFNEETAVSVVDELQDDPDFFKELIRHRVIKKQFLLNEIPKNLSKQEFLDKLADDFTLCASRFPLSKFFHASGEAEIFRKILNDIVLIDRREYPQGFNELLVDYTLYMSQSPYIYQKEKKQPATPAVAARKPSVAAINNDIMDSEDTVRIHFDELLLSEMTPSKPIDAVTPDADYHMNDEDDADIDRSTEPLDTPLPIQDFEQLSPQQAIDDLIDEVSPKKGENKSAFRDQTAQKTVMLDVAALEKLRAAKSKAVEKEIIPDISLVQHSEDTRKSPYMIGFFDFGSDSTFLLKEEEEADHLVLREVPLTQASFKVVLSNAANKFMVNKTSNWYRPSPLQKTDLGWEATIIRKSDNIRHFFYLEKIPSKPSRVPDPVFIAAEEPILPPELKEFESSVPTSSEPSDDIREMSISELSQALLDGVIDFEQYNQAVNQKNIQAEESPPMEEPDVILDEGVNYCYDWHGKFSSSNEHEADLRIMIFQNKFQMDVKDKITWTTVFKDQEIPNKGFQSSFQKTIIFRDPTRQPNDKEAVKRIVKEYSFQIIRLFSNKFGIKFM